MWNAGALTRDSFAVAAALPQGIWQWIVRLGAFGFIPLGLADASVVPLPGSMDILLIILAASHREWWLYYALFATVGSLIGGWVTYRMARKGGDQALGKKKRPKLWNRVEKLFARSGFATVSIAAILPPPVPLVPFVMAAGAARYPLPKFLVALACGRLVRYMILGFFAARYGGTLLGWIAKLGNPLYIAICAVVLIAGAAGLLIYLRKHHKPQEEKTSQKKAA